MVLWVIECASTEYLLEDLINCEGVLSSDCCPRSMSCRFSGREDDGWIRGEVSSARAATEKPPQSFLPIPSAAPPNHHCGPCCFGFRASRRKCLIFSSTPSRLSFHSLPGSPGATEISSSLPLLCIPSPSPSVDSTDIHPSIPLLHEVWISTPTIYLGVKAQ